MSRFKIAFQARQGADGTVAEAEKITAPSLYLDTSDLSYLILGRLRPGDHRPRHWRARLVELLDANRVRVRLSIVHAAELALRSELIPGALDLIDSTADLYIASTSPTDIFRQELDPEHEGPLVLVERRLGRAELENIRIPLRFWPRGISGRSAARLIKLVLRGAAYADSWGKRAALGDGGLPSEERKRRKQLARGLMKGDAAPLRWWIRPLSEAASGLTQHMLARRGLPNDLVDRVHRKEQQGTAWATSLCPQGRGPRRDGRGWNAEDVVAMPASTLRACVERAYRADLRRPPEARTAYDVQHIAYAAYSDFSTIDGPNVDAIKSIYPKHLSHLSIYPTGDLEPVLGAIESR